MDFRWGHLGDGAGFAGDFGGCWAEMELDEPGFLDPLTEVEVMSLAWESERLPFAPPYLFFAEFVF
jgi:hypothetical protein